MELGYSYLPTQAARYCCSWAGKQPQKRSLNLKPKQIGASIEGQPKASFGFEKVFCYIPVVVVADSGWIETACYARVESTALLPSLPSNTLSSILFKLEKLLPLEYIICLKQNFGKSDNRAKGKKQTRDGVEPFPRNTFPSKLSHPTC